MTVRWCCWFSKNIKPSICWYLEHMKTYLTIHNLAVHAPPSLFPSIKQGLLMRGSIKSWRGNHSLILLNPNSCRHWETDMCSASEQKQGSLSSWVTGLNWSHAVILSHLYVLCSCVRFYGKPACAAVSVCVHVMSPRFHVCAGLSASVCVL